MRTCDTLESNSAEFLALLRLGPVQRHQIGVDNTTLYLVVKCLERQGHVVERIDAGGNPTWRLKRGEEGHV